MNMTNLDTVTTFFSRIKPKSTSGPVLLFCAFVVLVVNSSVPRNCFGGGGQQIQLTEGRKNRDLGAVAPQSGVPHNLQMGETRILIRFLGCIFHGTGNSDRLGQNCARRPGGGGGWTPKNPPLGTPVVVKEGYGFYSWQDISSHGTESSGNHRLHNRPRKSTPIYGDHERESRLTHIS
jgi:hypothetical protein